MNHEDEIARLRAETDRAIEATKQFAHQLRAFYVELGEQGFTTLESLRLTQTYLGAMFGQSSKESES